ncbi:hypothetical protein GGR26_003048 [Lewinella marina]|uniref:Uncharacterized protein n=1 Tax=Neolewinella marina TaxID=438751 RepID=A0A2G0CEK7_9BACT|nr:hypothetical protein [Neolewinella marina]NJB87268.1 hypothetical protein [Neolewinella marina]PHK98408.1 hypothetical protein CGL56_11990 [Neolewinella marina]
MLSLFRTNQSFASLLLFGYALLLQLPVLLLGTPPVVEEGTYFSELITRLVAGNFWLTALLPPLLLALAGIVANNISDRFRFSRTTTQFPGLVLVLLWGVVPAFHAFTPAALGHTFLLLAMGGIGSTYKGRSPEVGRFNAGWWLGLAALLQPTYLLFLPAFIVGISILGTANLRTIFQLLVGTFIAFFLGGTVAYLSGGWPAFANGELAGFGFGNFAPASRYDLIGLGILALGLLVALLSGTGSRALLSIEGAKNNAFAFWVLLFSPLVGLLGGVVDAADAQAVLPPLGILLGLWLARRPEARAEFFHLLVFAAALTLTVVSLYR